MQMPLSKLRVVEIGSAAGASYCARLFADFGAQVSKVESPVGDPLRRSAPLTPQGQSAWFAFLNFNKSSVAIDPNDRDASSQLSALIEDCDILIDGRAIDPAGCPPLDIDVARKDNPGLIHIDTSWFGHDGPYANFAATDATLRALAGHSKLTGPADGTPVGAPDFQTGIFTGLWSFIAAASSVIGRTTSGRGCSKSINVFEASIAIVEYIVFESFTRGDIMKRIGVNRFWPTFPVGIYETKEGWLGITTVTPAQWKSFCDMLGLQELRDDPTITLGVDRLLRMEEIERKFIPILKQKTAREWFAEGLKRFIPIVVVPGIGDLIENGEARSRGAIIPIKLGTEAGFTVGSAQRLTATPPRASGVVPAIGETQPVAEPAPARIATKPASTGAQTAGLPLDGVRVIDFSMGWAGPLCTRTLADLGADVIKIEACKYPDWWRGVDRRLAYIQGKEYEKVARFQIMNRNKRGITLDLTHPEGLQLAKQLIAGADVVVDNYSVEILPKLGLGYEVLNKINPKLVMMSMSAFGSNSVNRHCRAYGSTLEQGSGYPSVVGFPDDPPTMSHTAFGDPVGGLNGAAAVLTALIHARLTGQGQFIDLSQIECMMPFAAPWVIAHSIDGKEPVRYGNRHPDFIPRGCFPCAGDDQWIAIAVSSDAMWQRLCGVLGRADWASDNGMRTAGGRRQREDEIEGAIADWTAGQDPDAAMAELQAANVAAGVMRRPIDMLTDPQLQACAFIQEIDRPFIGRHPQPSLPIREAGALSSIRLAAPTLGQHNNDILGGLLGLSCETIERLTRDGVIGTAMLGPGVVADVQERAAS
jgi:crotonobetainyl-CoA:carnitine CoA-transferase CaiB-like acyl-CoA transferase